MNRRHKEYARRAAAYHEAGHGKIGDLYCLPWVYLRVTVDGQDGECRYHPDILRTLPHGLYFPARLHSAAAGPPAWKYAKGRGCSHWSAWLYSGDGDRREIKKIETDTGTKWTDADQEQVNHLVRQHWGEITEMAEALLSAPGGFLSREMYFDGVIPTPPPWMSAA